MEQIMGNSFDNSAFRHVFESLNPDIQEAIMAKSREEHMSLSSVMAIWWPEYWAFVEEPVIGRGTWIQIRRGGLWHYQRGAATTRCGLAVTETPHQFSKPRPQDLGRVCAKCRGFQDGDFALLQDERKEI